MTVPKSKLRTAKSGPVVCWQFPEDYIQLLYCHVQHVQRYKAILERDGSIYKQSLKGLQAPTCFL